ncbi:MAG: hypothetical protein F6K35_51970, partial [Okeania sp. SIO2H7]|nr:hypothetical protein [Okeania sp. SIO2H7]
SISFPVRLPSGNGSREEEEDREPSNANNNANNNNDGQRVAENSNGDSNSNSSANGTAQSSSTDNRNTAIEPTPRQNSSANPPSTNPQAIRNIPGIPVGASANEVNSRLGAATEVSTGPRNTRVESYAWDRRVDLAYVYDQSTNRVQKSSARFSKSVDSLIMRIALNGMMGNQLTPEIEAGLEEVRQGQASQYNFAVGTVQGSIERDGDRLHVQVWSANP